MAHHLFSHDPAHGPDTVITGNGLSVSTAIDTGHTSNLITPALPTVVWLASDASLMRSHLHQADDERPVVNVVGVANCDELGGWVLMLS